jgi:hypothetical protein
VASQKVEQFGMKFPANWTALDRHLYCIKTQRTIDQGALGVAEHFWSVVALLYGPKNPVGNKTKIFIRNPWSEKMIDEAVEQQYIGVGGPAASSKTETFALWMLINYIANPRNVLGVMLSTSLKEARQRGWGSLVEFIRAVPALGQILKVVHSQGIIRYNSPTFTASDKQSLSLVAAERSQEKEAIGKLIGKHNEWVMVMADELTELTNSILEYALPGGNLASNPRHQFIGLANPSGYYDPFAAIWKPKAGWTSISVDSERWETAHGIALHLDANKSPNVLAGRVLYPFLPTIQKIEAAKKAEGGENSIRYWRMMRGFMCPVGQEDLIYNETDIVKSGGDIPAVWNDEPVIKIAALDPGFTNGGDRSIAFLGTLGKTTTAVRALNFDLYEELVADVTNKEQEHSEQIARKFRAFCEKHGVLPQNAAVDSTGAGGPFCNILSMVWSNAILRVYFGGKASDLPVSMTDPRLGFEAYFDRVTEIWYSGVELLRQGQLKGILPDQAQEMCLRKYGTTGVLKRIYAESKKDMKLRTGGRSPDIADPSFMLIALARERHGFAAVATAGQRKAGSFTSWSQRCRKLNAALHQQRIHLDYAARPSG